MKDEGELDWETLIKKQALSLVKGEVPTSTLSPTDQKIFSHQLHPLNKHGIFIVTAGYDKGGKGFIKCILRTVEQTKQSYGMFRAGLVNDQLLDFEEEETSVTPDTLSELAGILETRFITNKWERGNLHYWKVRAQTHDPCEVAERMLYHAIHARFGVERQSICLKNTGVYSLATDRLGQYVKKEAGEYYRTPFTVKVLRYDQTSDTVILIGDDALGLLKIAEGVREVYKVPRIQRVTICGNFLRVCTRGEQFKLQLASDEASETTTVKSRSKKKMD